MGNELIWYIIATILAVAMLLFNSKTRIIKVIAEQFKVFCNAKTKKPSLWDIMCFVVFPIIISVIIIFGAKIQIPTNLGELFATIFSLIFTILFGFAALIIGKIETGNKIEKQIIEETFVSIISSTLLSLFATVLSIIVTILTNSLAQRIVWSAIFSVSIMDVMLMLLITKRTYIIFCSKK